MARALPPGVPRWAYPGYLVYKFLKKHVARIIGLVLLLICMLLITVTLLLRSEGFARYVIDKALPIANNALPATIVVGGYSGALGTQFELRDVTVADEHGDIFISAHRIQLQWEFWDLLRKDVSVGKATLEDPRFVLKQRDDGSLNVVRAFVKPGPKKETEGKGQKPLPIDIEVGDIDLSGGAFVFERADGSRIVDVDGIVLQGAYSLRGFEHDAALRRVGADLHAPIDIPRVELSGGARMDAYELDVDDIQVRWKDDRVAINGTLGPVQRIHPNLAIRVEQFDLADVQEFAPSAPLRGLVQGDLRLTGTLDDLRLAGPITTASGGRVQIEEAGVRLGSPLGHHANLTLTRLDLAELLAVPQLPPPLTGSVRWDGSGTGPDTLQGDAVVQLARLDYQKMLIGPIALNARLQDWSVRLADTTIGLAGGTVRPRGRIDLAKRCFDMKVGGGIRRLQDLKRRTNAPFTSGALALDVGAVGCWGTEDAVVALTSTAKVGLENLALTPADTRARKGQLGWTLDVRVPKQGAPEVTGPFELDLLDLVTAKQVITTAVIDGSLQGTNVEFEADLESGGDIGLDLTGNVDWGSLPELRITGRGLTAWYRSLRLSTRQEFVVKLRNGAVEASGLVADTDKDGTFILQGTLDPKGEANAVMRLLSFDLVQTDAFLPENGRLSGELNDLTVKLSGTLAKPGISVHTRLRNFATRGRGPVDLDLDLELADEVFSGTAKLADLVELEVARIPMSFRLDGKGGLPFFIPAGEPLEAEVRLIDGPLARFEPGLGKPLPPSYVGGRVRGAIQLGGTSTQPTASGAFLLRDLLVDLERLEAKTSAEADVGRTDRSREINVRGAYELAEGVFELRDTQVRTTREGTVLELGMSGNAPLDQWLMGRLGPRELRRDDLPPLLSDLEFSATLRRLPMTLVHLIAPAAEPVTGAITGNVSVTGALSDPSVDAKLRLIGGRVGDRPLKKAALLASVAGGVLNTELEVLPTLLPDELEPKEEAAARTTKQGKKAQGKAKRGKAKKTAEKAGRKDAAKGGARKSAVASADAATNAARDKARALLARDPDAGRLLILAQAPLPLALDGSRTVQEMLGQPGLQGEVRSDAFPLPVLLAFLPGAMNVHGELTLAGQVEGSLLDPKPDVALRMEDGRFQYQKTSVSYEDIDVDISLSPASIEVREVSVDTLPLIRNPLDLVFKPNVTKDTRVQGKKSLVLNGRVALDGWRPADVDVDVKVFRLWGMYTQEIKAQVDAELKATGAWPHLVVRGNVDVDDVDIDLGQESTGRSVQSLELPDNLYVHRKVTAAGPGERSLAELEKKQARMKDPTLLDRLDLDVMVHLGNKVHGKLAVGLAQARDDALRAFNLIGSIEPDVNLGGDVRVLMKDGRRRFEGAIEVTRDSTLTVLTKKFEIVPGSRLTLVGDLFDSQLDVDADFPSSYGTITVQVRDTLAKPSITFTSEELADQADMMAVLIVGRPLSEASTGEGQGVAKTISGALAGFGTKILGKYTPLDKFDVDLGDDMSSGSVEAGKAITPELFLLSRFRWGVENDYDNRVEAEVQWRPRQLRRFAIEGHIGDRLAGGLQVVWRILY